MTTNYVLRKSGQGEFWFLLKAHTGEVLLTSKVYTDKDTALRRISAARMLAHNEKNFEIVTKENGESYSLLRNARQEVIAQSETYPDAESLRAGIRLIKAKTRGAQLEDESGT